MPFLEYALMRDTLRAFPGENRDALYLLNEHGAVIAARAADSASPAVGDSFFRSFPVLREEEGRLFSSLDNGNSLLILSGNRPALAWRFFFARTRLLALWLPNGEACRALSAPAAYADICAHHHVTLAPSALARYQPIDEQSYPAVNQWLHEHSSPLFYTPPAFAYRFTPEGKPQIEAMAAIEILARRSADLAALVGINLTYDWGGIGFSPIPAPDFQWIAAALLTLFLAVRRAAKDAALSLSVAHEGNDGPVLEARFVLRETGDPLPELLPLRQHATQSGELFEAFPHPEDPHSYFVKLSLCRKELSLQGLKTTPRFC